MFSTYDSTVNSLYLAFYGRPADPSGLKFWSQALAANNGDAGTIIGAFATSQEAQNRFGSDDAGARITAIYEQLFNRAPDAAGLAYWTGAVETGKATLAEVSVAILKGAQGSDLDLSTLRQKAADAFTAAVEDGSTEYSGYASIEAARVLVRAVTADATDADLANLVKAAVSFADTATKTPKVVEAIATGSTLLNLYGTERGTKDPVALTQALADTAKAAAGDPVTLESLLRGGGMDKVLKVMPTKATLTDVVEALAKGGLPAAVDVVYPPATPAPAPSTSMVLTFDSVSQGPFDTNKKDNITNVEVATVKFSYTGSDLKAGQTFQYSIDGESWTDAGVSTNAATNIVTITGVNLTGKTLLQQKGAEFFIQGPAQPVANVITTVQLRAVDAAKNVIVEGSGKVEYDGTPPTGLIEYKGIVYGNSCTMTDPVASYANIAILEHDVIQWHIEGDADWTDMDQSSTGSSFKLDGLDLNKSQTVEVRVIDAAGNVGYKTSHQIGAGNDDSDSGGTIGDGGGLGGPLLSVMPDMNGLKITTGIKGEVQIAAGKEIHPLKFTVDPITGSSIAGAQDIARSGKVQLELPNTFPEVDPSGTTYTLGTNGKDEALSGSFVWGFDGDDTIIGTAGVNGQNVLIGGAGNDTIIGGAGQDMVYGGTGGDLLDLGVDGAHDRVFIEKGEAATPDFVDGASSLGIDKIKNFSGDDAIQLGISFGDEYMKFQSTYLDDNSGTRTVAVVRGEDVEGAFSAGDTSHHVDYMIQWREGDVLNSVILKDYGVKAPTLTAAGKLISHITVPKATSADYLNTKFTLSGNLAAIQIVTTDGLVKGVANADSFILSDITDGVSLPVPGYDQSTSQMFVSGGNVLLKTSLPMGAYKMSWSDDTFTTGNGYLKADATYFAGGIGADFAHTGFELTGQPYPIEGGGFSPNDIASNEAYIPMGSDVALHTGGGNDLVLADRGAVILSYDALDNSAQDLVIGFGADDKVKLGGDLRAFIDRDGNGIDWAEGNEIGMDTEAVQVTLPGYFTVGDGADMTDILFVLNDQINVNNVGLEQHLLILAQGLSGGESVLFAYENKDGGLISANELTTIATFSNGALTSGQIEPVGVSLDHTSGVVI
jgi:hypothetical protein